MATRSKRRIAQLGGLIKGTSDIGGDVATVAVSAVEGAIDAAKSIGVKAEDAASAAASGAVEAAGEVSEATAKAVTDAVAKTIQGVKVVCEGTIEVAPFTIGDRTSAMTKLRRGLNSFATSESPYSLTKSVGEDLVQSKTLVSHRFFR